MGKNYKCSFGSNGFHLIKKEVKYRTENRSEAVLVCSECSKDYHIQPCSLGGLAVWIKK